MITEQTIYICDVCKNKYTNKEDAIQCSQLPIKEITIKPGDTVKVRQGFVGYVDAVVAEVRPNKHGYMFKTVEEIETLENNYTSVFFENPKEYGLLLMKSLKENWVCNE